MVATRLRRSGQTSFLFSPAALFKRQFRPADLLSKHGAVVNVRDREEWTPLYVAAGMLQSVDIMRCLLKHGVQ
jgi:ankyrin repeat protein